MEKLAWKTEIRKIPKTDYKIRTWRNNRRIYAFSV